MYFPSFLPFLALTYSCCIASPYPTTRETASPSRATPGLHELPSLSSSNIDLQRAACVIYTVPGTSIKVRFFLGHPLDKAAMGETILAAYNFIRFAISHHGDGDLPPQEDPFLMDEHYGASIRAVSAPGHKLTWGILKGAIVGLHDALFLAGKYVTASFEIWDGNVALVGRGRLAMASPAATVASHVTSNVLRNVTMEG
ncbi:hypothetical protein N7G274_004176 [Stereocaulon virgatum]|uniref:Uncharacterized protein n=1 Tax=Stereocaulon virgatum TaxID=373712 RepID=A0ABR4AE61_9LECA